MKSHSRLQQCIYHNYAQHPQPTHILHSCTVRWLILKVNTVTVLVPTAANDRTEEISWKGHNASAQSQRQCCINSSTQSQQHCYLDSSTQSQQQCSESSTQSQQQDSSTHPSLFQPENQFGTWSSGLSYTQSKQTSSTLNLLHQHVLSRYQTCLYVWFVCLFHILHTLCVTQWGDSLLCVIYCSQSEKQDDSQELFSHSCQHSFGSGLTQKQDIAAETKHGAFGVKVSTQCHLDQYWNTTNRKKPANTSTPCTMSAHETASPLPGSESKGKTLRPSSGDCLQCISF